MFLRKIFISYAIGNPEHVAWVARFAADLDRYEIETYFDQNDVGYGDSFRKFMSEGIAQCSYFLFISTNDSRKVADLEIPGAQERGLWFELEQFTRQVTETPDAYKMICVLLEGDAPPKRFLHTRYADFRDPSRYESNLHSLAMELKHGKRKLPPREQFTVKWTRGNVTIPDIVPELTFLGERALHWEQLRSVDEDQSTVLLPDLVPAWEAYIEQKMRESRGNFTFDDNASYDLRSLTVERPQTATGERRNLYVLHTRPTSYYHFVFPNLVLDQEINLQGTSVLPRNVLGLQRESLRFDTLAEKPCSFHLGSGTVLITADNKIVVSIRSKRQFIVGGLTYHLSAAEGALRPADEVNGEFSPFCTSVRSLEDELGLIREVDFRLEDLRCLGILLDTLRAQPICLFYLRSSTITAQRVYQKWQTDSNDKHENNNLHFMDWNENTARILLEGRLQVDTLLYEIASNHAQSGFLLAALYEFGESVVT